MEKVKYVTYKVLIARERATSVFDDMITIPENKPYSEIPAFISAYVRTRLENIMLTEEERAEIHNENETYEQGLDDAWEAARKILCTEKEGVEKTLSTEEIDQIFGEVWVEKVFAENTAAEAIAKIKAYEEKQNAFESGDVVKYKNDDKHQKFIYLYTDGNGKIARCLIYAKKIDTVVCVAMPLELLEKTGEHINIKEMLK